MARSGYCTNDKLIELVKERYKSVWVTPLMIYTEEYYEYLKEHAIENDYTWSEVLFSCRQNFKHLQKSYKMRYKKLANAANTLL